MAIFNNSPTPEESGDCLTISVYAPATIMKDKAVMYWLFGGSTQFGTAGQDLYDGAHMAANQDVIIVTVNYRTNVEYFLLRFDDLCI
jgi:carboxylesterase type B